MANLETNLPRWAQWTAAAAFCVLIASPLIGAVCHIGTTSAADIERVEFRYRTAIPSADRLVMDTSGYTSELGSAFDDRIGFRGILLKGNRYINVCVFGQSPAPGYAVLGKDHWMFLQGEVDYWQLSTPFTDAQLASFAQSLEEIRARLAAKGIHYLVVIAPNKSTIYPEKLPPSVVRGRARRTDQLYDYLAAHTAVDTVDLRPALMAAKPRWQLYSKTDTHWNDLGGLVGAQQIDNYLRTWFPSVRAPQIGDFVIRKRPLAGDLARGASDVLPDQFFWLDPRTPRLARQLPKTPDQRRDKSDFTFTMAIDGSKLPRLVMFRDSFTGALQPFLSEQFSRAAYEHGTDITWYDESLIDRERPNVVIVEVVERDLLAAPVR